MAPRDSYRFDRPLMGPFRQQLDSKERVMDLFAEECAADKPGGEMIVERLLEVMLVESLRWSSLHTGAPGAGLLPGMQDPAIAGALRAAHADVRRQWTVAELAKCAGMSRSAFASRFVEVVGAAPKEYLTRWRMMLAQDALCHGVDSPDQLAEQLGYGSASAFSTAFRKRTGSAPQRFARTQRELNSALPFSPQEREEEPDVRA
ncbi:MAG: AraC family transcriptional regulator [Acidobacteria bacterium]|nr:AraC family transcriptional regulator [Acidobacteriota bacterium]